MKKKDCYRILVLEDEVPLLEAIKQKLERNGFSVVTARSADQGYAYLGDIEDISAIWVDHYLLGKENGLDFVAKIKADNSKLKDIPIFVVSNTATQDKVSSYMELGVHKYYVKANHRLDEIIEEIKKACHNC